MAQSLSCNVDIHQLDLEYDRRERGRGDSGRDGAPRYRRRYQMCLAWQIGSPGNLGEGGLVPESPYRTTRSLDADPHRGPKSQYMEVPVESGDEGEEIEPLLRSRWSAATMKVLSSMPSRTVEQNGVTLISQRAKRRAPLSGQQSSVQMQDLSSPAGPSVQCDVVPGAFDEIHENENKHQQLVFQLRSLPAFECARLLRATPLNLREKIELRKRACVDESTPVVRGGLSCCSGLSLSIVRAWHRFSFGCLAILSPFWLWQKQLKTLSGRFGTGVLSYFLFLRTLLLFNLLFFLIVGLFLVLPQALDPPPRGSSLIDRFSGLELLTGEGYLSQSVMFYGYYINTTARSCRPPGAPPGAPDDTRPACDDVTGPWAMEYNIPVAYLFTALAGFVITCVFLVYSISKSFGGGFRVLKSHGNMALSVFCCWDFKVSKKTSVQLQSQNISTQFKELLSEELRGDGRQSCLRRLRRLKMHLWVWALCLTGVLLSCLATNHLSQHMHDKGKMPNVVEGGLVRQAQLLVLPGVVSSINLLLPGLFNLLSTRERYDSTRVRIYVSISRNLLLKFCVLGVLCYHWFGRIAAEPDNHRLQCWESFVGMELYRLILMDFIFTLLETFIGEFLWRRFSRAVLRRDRKPAFDIARNVLQLIYGQALMWLGVFFAPLLPAVQILKLVLLFYIKKVSLVSNCQAHQTPWRASQMTMVFLSLLCFPSFIGAVVCLMYTVGMTRPSSRCGPFTNFQTMLEARELWGQALAATNPTVSWFCWAYSHLVENPLVLCLTSGVFLMVIYIHAQVFDGQRRVISLLEKQLENQGNDKKFLINKLQEMYKQKDKI